MAGMLLTILKIAAGLAVLGIISIVLIAVVSGLLSSARAFVNRDDQGDNSSQD
jgi:hypothetical protein